MYYETRDGGFEQQFNLSTGKQDSVPGHSLTDISDHLKFPSLYRPLKEVVSLVATG